MPDQNQDQPQAMVPAQAFEELRKAFEFMSRKAQHLNTPEDMVIFLKNDLLGFFYQSVTNINLIYQVMTQLDIGIAQSVANSGEAKAIAQSVERLVEGTHLEGVITDAAEALDNFRTAFVKSLGEEHELLKLFDAATKPLFDEVEEAAEPDEDPVDGEGEEAPETPPLEKPQEA